MPPKKKTDAEIIDDKSDVKGLDDGKVRKQFVIQGLRIDNDRDAELNADAVKDDFRMDVGNKQATLQEALTRGLHPKAEPELESVEFVGRGLNWTSYQLTYAVACVPAAGDLDPDGTVLPVDREDDKRQRVRLARLRAEADPAGFAE